MNETIISQPLSLRGKILMWAIFLECLALWIISLYAYATLPDEVPTHFGALGKPTSYGDKSTFLILPFAFSIAPVIFLVITGFRFTLINKYPYLINLPAFYINIYKLPKDKRSAWVNKYFELILALGVAISLWLLFLLVTIYQGTLEGQLPVWFTPVAIILPILLLVPFFYALSRLSRKMKNELDT